MKLDLSVSDSARPHLGAATTAEGEGAQLKLLRTKTLGTGVVVATYEMAPA
jgi:hypothetical protein